MSPVVIHRGLVGDCKISHHQQLWRWQFSVVVSINEAGNLNRTWEIEAKSKSNKNQTNSNLNKHLIPPLVGCNLTVAHINFHLLHYEFLRERWCKCQQKHQIQSFLSLKQKEREGKGLGFWGGFRVVFKLGKRWPELVFDERRVETWN